MTGLAVVVVGGLAALVEAALRADDAWEPRDPADPTVDVLRTDDALPQRTNDERTLLAVDTDEVRLPVDPASRWPSADGNGILAWIN